MLRNAQPNPSFASDMRVDDKAIWRKHKEELIRRATMLVGADHAEDVLRGVVERVLRRGGSMVQIDDAWPLRSDLDERETIELRCVSEMEVTHPSPRIAATRGSSDSLTGVQRSSSSLMNTSMTRFKHPHRVTVDLLLIRDDRGVLSGLVVCKISVCT